MERTRSIQDAAPAKIIRKACGISGIQLMSVVSIERCQTENSVRLLGKARKLVESIEIGYRLNVRET